MDRLRDEFIHRCNVFNYARLLRDAPNAPRRKVLMELLAEEDVSAKRHGWLPILGWSPTQF